LADVRVGYYGFGTADDDDNDDDDDDVDRLVTN
jgi:hypothetical protein